MIVGLLALLSCQLLGEFLATLLDLPIPGPILGMVILLIALQVKEPSPGSGLVTVAEGLLKHLQLLFVPAGVGVISYFGVIGAAVVPILVGLFVGWFVTLAVTAGTMAALLLLSRRTRGGLA